MQQRDGLSESLQKLIDYEQNGLDKTQKEKTVAELAAEREAKYAEAEAEIKKVADARRAYETTVLFITL